MQNTQHPSTFLIASLCNTNSGICIQYCSMYHHRCFKLSSLRHLLIRKQLHFLLYPSPRVEDVAIMIVVIPGVATFGNSRFSVCFFFVFLFILLHFHFQFLCSALNNVPSRRNYLSKTRLVRFSL